MASEKHFVNFAHDIAKCTTCKRYEGGTYQIPPQPALPDFRVTDDFAFTRVGVNFAGPVYAKPIFPAEKNLPTFKTYICLFTCASSPALHLELVPDLSTKAFIRCLLRFMSRRGNPENICV